MRFTEIDIVKGIAVAFMVIFHFFYLAYFMNVKKFPIDKGILRFLAKSAHTTFIFMVGVNLAVSYQRNIKLKKDKDAYVGKQVKRSFFLFMSGMMVSIASYLAFKDMFVKFGIFHFIATAILLSQFVIHNKLIALICGTLIFLISFLKENFNSMLYDKCLNIPFICFITGLYNIKYSSLDHFPIIPYLGFVFFGIFVGHSLYNNFQRTFDSKIIDNISDNTIFKNLGFLGKHSLMIYFIHFPLFYFILYAYKNFYSPKTDISNL